MAVQPIIEQRELPFGDYVLLRRLAVGGMAEIFLARAADAAPGEFIVIKRLLTHIADSPALVNMFLDEGRIAATLDHPNIVKIYNVGTVGDHFFLSMEHLVGIDLSKLNRMMHKQGRVLPMQHALFACHGIARALEYAHNHRGRKGEPLHIVHRDLSPHNVFITFDGTIKLLDFGVAKAANALHKTKTGALVGKLSYMSPEHCNNEAAVDHRSDLFSLGIILWELSVGKRLYNTKKLGEYEVLRRITQEPVTDPGSIVEDYPEVVKDVLDRALRKDRAERFQSAGEFADAIEDAAEKLGFTLTSGEISSFISTDLPDVVKRITSSIRELKRPSSAVVNESGSFNPSQLSPSLPSPVFPSSPMESINFEEDDEERTERRSRTSRPRVVKWAELPKVTAEETSEGAPRAAIAIGAVVLLILAGFLTYLLLG